jgi:hypothetical protein
MLTKAQTLRKLTRKPKLLRSNPHRVPFSLDDNDDDLGLDDDSLQTGYRRPQIVKDKVPDKDDDISDEIKWRLFLARQLALLKYQEKWGS